MEFEPNLQIGNLGEKTFSTWCSAAGLTSNSSSEEDRTGWDYQIEFPYIKTNLPRDTQKSPIQCRVQVKASQRKDRRWSIKASVLKRLIDYSYPSFFVFLEFTNDSEPVIENAFLLHIDKEIIEKTLKKIRENDNCANKKELNEIKINIAYNFKNKIKKNSGEEVKKAILDYIPEYDIAKYQDAKSRIVQNVGYGEGSRILKFQASIKDFKKHIIASSIGTENHGLKIINPVFLDNRFNLKNGSFEISSSSFATLNILPNVIDTCHLRFKESEFSPSTNFMGKFISTLDLTNHKKPKLFITTNLFSLEIGEMCERGKFDAKIIFTFEKPSTLDEIIKFIRLFNDRESNSEKILEIEMINKKVTFPFKISINHDFDEYKDFPYDLIKIKETFSIDSEKMISLEETISNNLDIKIMSLFIQNKTESFRFKINDESKQIGNEASTIHTFFLPFGNLTLAAIFLLHGSKSEINADASADSYMITKSELLKPLVFKDKTPSAEEIRSLEEAELFKINSR